MKKELGKVNFIKDYKPPFKTMDGFEIKVLDRFVRFRGKKETYLINIDLINHLEFHS